MLVLGDSFTFGIFLDNHDAFPNLLDTRFDDKEIVNAGICGYTIPDETALFIERAKYIEPDIVILQVLDSDVPSLFFLKRNIYDRSQEAFEPSKEEIEFLKKLVP